jgi:acetyl esterase/lipase
VVHLASLPPSPSLSTTLPVHGLRAPTGPHAHIWGGGDSRLIELALSHDAIIISPDYRLLPEATGADTLADVARFWDWLHATLPSTAAPWHARPDLANIACAGQSCGGRLAAQSALLFPHAHIRALISISAPLHGAVPHFTVPRPKIIMGARPPPPRQAEALVRAYLKAMPPGALSTGRDPSPDLWELVLCIIQQGWLPRLMTRAAADDDERRRLDIMATLDTVQTMPPIWVIHGEQDSIVCE